MGMFSGKVGLVLGVTNEHSIAWAMSKALHREEAELGFTHLSHASTGRRVQHLVEPLHSRLVMPCDVQSDDDIARVFQAAAENFGKLDFLIHSIAFAPPEDLRKPYVESGRAGWHLAMDTSVYSLVAVSRAAIPLMSQGGSILTVTYFGGEKVMPGYNLMGVCKAALDHSVRYLAWDLGRKNSKNIRVNAISAGPVRTLSSAGIPGFEQMRDHAAQKSCLGRNTELGDLAGAALFLLSDMSQGMTGEILHVDCGYNIVGL